MASVHQEFREELVWVVQAMDLSYGGTQTMIEPGIAGCWS